eukprot:TRINITY_DN79179_c0_g1_i1.p1 TRINITY_DN79179_c0_g1~~TRINITY_DN79179_c0_g1_i1.p1  ORF type:complete len:191 (-),score=5.13 TRINITY_DN79179_c0_g1_i1:33-605(-)
MTDNKTHTHLPPFFLNITLLNGSDVVSNKVAEKAGTNLFGKAVSFAATKMVSDDTIVTKLGTALSEKVPEAIREMGITANVTKRYQFKSYIVLMVQVTDVDKLSLLLGVKGPDYASSFSTLLTALNKLELNEALDTIDDKIGDKIQNSLIEKFAEVIPEKVSKEGININCHVCKREDQAEFFYDTIERFQ